MKKLSFIIFFFFLFIGCSEKKKVVYENIMKDYAKIYYEENMRNINGQDRYDISIQALKNYNDRYEKKYDLSKLKDCDDDSYTSITVNDSKKITKYEHHLSCK